MGFRARKTYGQSKVSTCPFCGDKAFGTNSQGVPVCKKHTMEKMPDIKCTCGEWLDLKVGKWGPFYTCFNCGIIKMQRAMECLDLMGREKKDSSKGPKINRAITKNAPVSPEVAEARKYEEMAKKVQAKESSTLRTPIELQEESEEKPKKKKIPSLQDLAKFW